MSGITLWEPEGNVIIHQALGKLNEELAELSHIVARCVIQGIEASEPVTGKPNRRKLTEEMADVEAALEWLRDVTGIAGDSDRRYSKLDGFRRWQQMLEAANG